MNVDPRAGKPAEQSMLVDVARLVTSYYAEVSDPMAQEMTRGRPIPESANGYMYGASLPASRSATDYTPRIVPHFPGVAVPLEEGQIPWQR
jgi:hypothetical protein